MRLGGIVRELDRMRQELGPYRVLRSHLCDSPILVRWGDCWFLVEPANAASQSGEYLRAVAMHPR